MQGVSSDDSIEIVPLAETGDLPKELFPAPAKPSKPLPLPPAGDAVARPATPGLSGSLGASSSLQIGTRRSRDEELQRLREELAAASEDARRLHAENDRLRASRQRDKERNREAAARLTELMQEKQAHRMREADASQEVLRSHEMTLSVLSEYRDHVGQTEARLVAVDRLRALDEEELNYYRLRCLQAETLAKEVLVFAKKNGFFESSSELASVVAEVRKAHPVPKRVTDEENEARRNLCLVVEPDAMPQHAVLVERVKDFAHFMELKQQKARKSRARLSAALAPLQLDAGNAPPPSSPPSSTSPAPANSSAPSNAAMRDPPLSPVSSLLKREKRVASVSKAAQLMGMESGAVRAAEEARVGVLAAQRALPSQHPYFEWPSVKHVRELSAKVEAILSAASRPGARTPQIDALREEANAVEPNVEWLATEIVGGSGADRKGIAASVSDIFKGSTLTNKKRAPTTSYKLDPEWRTDSGSSLLHVLVRNDAGARALEELITRHGFDPLDVDLAGFSAIHIAILHGAGACVARLLKVSPHTMECACLGELTPFLLAALRGNTQVCRLLLEAGANTTPDRHGSSALVYALLAGHTETASFLAERVAGMVQQCDDEGSSPLLIACCVSNKPLVSKLLRCGADINCANQTGFSPVWSSLQLDDSQLVQVLLGTAGLEFDRSFGVHRMTILHLAVLFLSDKKIEWVLPTLIRRGASVNSCNDENKTPLTIATMLDRHDAIRMLLEAGADANFKDCAGNRPLHFAQSVDAVSSLVANGAKINVKNLTGQTPLHHVHGFGNKQEVAQLLVGLGASESVTNANGETPEQMSQYEVRLCVPFFKTDLASVSTGGVLIQKRGNRDL